ncbi:MAG: hypothetical protein HOH62_11960 [Verrucomicrobia bacterium]|nr:hypothetical protein [Verrucomicrobiota bacterium]MBT6104609.1 hypothetical protein [Verrucomicrobiota bacterium]
MTPIPLRRHRASAKTPADMWRLFKECLSFAWREKKWWLIPLIVALVLLAALILFSTSSALAPFMYPFM